MHIYIYICNRILQSTTIFTGLEGRTICRFRLWIPPLQVLVQADLGVTSIPAA